jgi:uncharacterized Rossmann fold enzyme
LISKIVKLKSKIPCPHTTLFATTKNPHIIANGASCDPKLLGELLKCSPLVIVLDSAMERVMKLNIKVDVLLGDFDRDFDANYYNISIQLK